MSELRALPHTTVKMVLGPREVPPGFVAIGTQAVVSDATGNNGALIRHEKTGMYCFFSYSGVSSVCQRAAREYEEAVNRLYRRKGASL